MNARNKGNQYERDLAKELVEFFPGVVTSRSESKRTDDSGVDFCYTGVFNIQAKAWERAPAYHEVLKRMPGINNLIFHKRNNKGTTVTMPKDVFYMLLRTWIESKKDTEN